MTNIEKITNALQRLGKAGTDDTKLAKAAKDFFIELGYESEREFDGVISAEKFVTEFGTHKGSKEEQFFLKHVDRIPFLFQVGNEEIDAQHKSQGLFTDEHMGFQQDEESFYFATVVLKSDSRVLPRGDYARLTRQFNLQRLNAPAVVLFVHPAERALCLAFVHRRPHRRDSTKQAVGRVSLLRAIDPDDPHRAHLNILKELSLSHCLQWIGDKGKQADFLGLRDAWLATLDIQELNNQFYRDLREWFEWAAQDSKTIFPYQTHKEQGPLEKEEQLITLLCRVLFIWFMKEKKLVAEELFHQARLTDVVEHIADPQHSGYYHAVLQNLFFATLNTPIDNRGWSKKQPGTHRVFNRYRYKARIKKEQQFRTWMNVTPFVNGGLFDCLDSVVSEQGERDSYRIDSFTDNNYRRVEEAKGYVHIPNKLFLDDRKGLIPLLRRYKFTVEESTPIEKDVALDPELLGMVFERLLAFHAKDTEEREEERENERKNTGSYYTPRTVVDYMVDESLLEYFMAQEQIQPEDGDQAFWRDRLQDLIDYETDIELIYDSEREPLVKAVADLRILDPAVGSGAFPMGLLLKLTHILRKLDPDNKHWHKLQKERTSHASQEAFGKVANKQDEENRLRDVRQAFQSGNDNDYPRKLFLIQNTLHGVDIQRTAIQLTKLRIFISLAIEQEANDDKTKNYGIRPLPNLEPRFIVADSLIPLFRKQQEFGDAAPYVQEAEQRMKVNLDHFFWATTRDEKKRYKKENKKIRTELRENLEKHTLLSSHIAEKIASCDILDPLQKTDWFDPDIMFSQKDFHIIIGNPPYVRQERIKHLKTIFKEYYDRFYHGKADLYTYFYHRGVRLLAENGTLCFITSKQFVNADYGKNLRHFLLTEAPPHQLIDLSSVDVFDASVSPMIVQVCKQDSAPAKDKKVICATLQKGQKGDFLDNMREKIKERRKEKPLSDFSPCAWSIEADEQDERILQKLSRNTQSLGDYAQGKIYMGVKTGFNDAFVIDSATRATLIQQHASSEELIKPHIRGRDIQQKWHAPTHKNYLIFTRQGINIKDYPAIEKHLKQFYDDLQVKPKGAPASQKGRAPGSYQWYELQASTAYYPAFAQPKIMYPDIRSELCACYDDTGSFCNNTGYIIAMKDFYLLSILNSQLLLWYACHNFSTMGGDAWAGAGLRCFTTTVEKLPIRHATAEQRGTLEDYVRRILDGDADTPALENKINACIYKLYGLEQDEIDHIEQALARRPSSKDKGKG